MSVMLKGLPRVIGMGFAETLLYFPVLFIPMVYLLPESSIPLWILVVILGYGLGYAGSYILRIKTFLMTFLWSSAVAVSISYILIGADIGLVMAVPSLYVTCYRGIRMKQTGISILYSGSYFFIGLAIYGVSSFILSFIERFQPYTLVMTGAGASALVMTLFMLNRHYVEEQTLPGSKKPIVEQRVLRQNRGMIIILIATIGGLSLLPMLQAWLSALGRSIATWIGHLLQTSPGEPESTPEIVPEAAEMPFANEPSEPSSLMEFLEKLAFYVVYIAAAALILYLLYRFVKVLPKLLQKGSAWLNRLMSHQVQDEAFLGYEDEEIEIEHEKVASRLKRLLASARWNGAIHKESESVDNATQIRRVYRRILTHKIREGYKWKVSKTPRETKRDMKAWSESDEPISDEFIRLYEQARYGHRSIRDEELNNNLKELKHHK